MNRSRREGGRSLLQRPRTRFAWRQRKARSCFREEAIRVADNLRNTGRGEFEASHYRSAADEIAALDEEIAKGTITKLETGA